MSNRIQTHVPAVDTTATGHLPYAVQTAGHPADTTADAREHTAHNSNLAVSLTAAARGTEWMNKWGCTPWCVEEHGQSGAMECHAAALTETQLRVADMDCTGYSENGSTLPWLSAQVVVCNEKPQAYGRETRVWMSYGVHVAEISPAQAREALDQMRAFTAQLAAVVDMADQVAADDFPGDPEVARLDTEATDRRIKAVGARA